MIKNNVLVFNLTLMMGNQNVLTFSIFTSQCFVLFLMQFYVSCIDIYQQQNKNIATFFGLRI